MSYLTRSISEPIRQGLNFAQRWHDEGRGLITCWERGREMREQNPELAKRAEQGELVPLPWKGGVEQKLKGDKEGVWWYLATWQGLCGDDLSIDTSAKRTMVCSKTGQKVIFDWKAK